jgi:hypothetical protein
MLVVFKPRHSTFLRWFNRWKVVEVVHTDGPVFFYSPREQTERMLELVEAGMSYIPDDVRAMTAMSVADVHEIIEDSLKPR